MPEHPQPERSRREAPLKLMQELRNSHSEAIGREQKKVQELRRRLTEVSTPAVAAGRQNLTLMREAMSLMTELESLVTSPAALANPGAGNNYDALRQLVDRYLARSASAAEQIAELEGLQTALEENTLGEQAKAVEKTYGERRKKTEESAEKHRVTAEKASASKSDFESTKSRESSAKDAKRDAEKAARKGRSDYDAKRRQFDELKALIIADAGPEKTARTTAETAKQGADSAVATAEQDFKNKKDHHQDLVDQYEGTTDVPGTQRKVDDLQRESHRAEGEHITAQSDLTEARRDLTDADAKLAGSQAALPALEAAKNAVDIDDLKRIFGNEERAFKQAQKNLNLAQNQPNNPNLGQRQQDFADAQQDFAAAKQALKDGNDAVARYTTAQRQQEQLQTRRDQAARDLNKAISAERTKGVAFNNAQSVVGEWTRRLAEAQQHRTEIRAAKRDYEAAEGVLNQARDTARKADEKLKAAEQKLAEVQEKITRADTEQADLPDEVAELETATRSLEAALLQAEKELREATRSRTAAETKYRNDQAEAERLKEEADQEASGLETWQKNLDKSQERTGEAGKKKATAETKRAGAKAEGERLRDRLKSVVNIPAEELFRMIGDVRMAEVVNHIITAGPEGSLTSAHAAMKEVFSTGINRQQFGRLLEGFGYTVDEFITAWREKLYRKPLELIRQSVTQETRNWFNNNISWKDTLGTNIKETAKLAAVNLAVVGGAVGGVGLAVSALGGGAALTVGATAGTGGLMRGLKKAYGWMSGKKRQEALSAARIHVEETKTSQMQNALIAQFRNPGALEEMAVCISQGLRDSSFEAAHRAYTPALLDANTQALADRAIEEIETEYERTVVNNPSRTVEAGVEKETNLRRLEGALLRLDSRPEMKRLIKEALAKDPTIVEVFKKIPGLRDMLPVGASSAEDREKAAIVIESVVAGGAIGAAISTVPGLRQAMGGLVGGILGAKFGKMLDRRAQEQSLRQEFEGQINQSRDIIRNYTNSTATSLAGTSGDEIRRLYNQLNATLSLGVLDGPQLTSLRVRGLDTAHTLRTIYIEQARRVSLENMFATLNADLADLSAAERRIKEQLLKTTTWRQAVGAVAGFAAGAVGIHYGGEALRSAAGKAGRAMDLVSDHKPGTGANIDNHHATGTRSSGNALEVSPPRPDGLDNAKGSGSGSGNKLESAPENLGGSFDRYHFAESHHLSEEEFNLGYKPLLEKYPALANNESLQAIFKASHGGRAVENILGDTKKTIFVELAKHDVGQAKAFLHDEQFFGEQHVSNRALGYLKDLHLGKDESKALDLLAEKVHAAQQSGGSLPNGLDKSLHQFFRAEESTDLANHHLSSDGKHDVRIPKNMRVLGIYRGTGEMHNKLILGGSGEAKLIEHTLTVEHKGVGGGTHTVPLGENQTLIDVTTRPTSARPGTIDALRVPTDWVPDKSAPTTNYQTFGRERVIAKADKVIGHFKPHQHDWSKDVGNRSTGGNLRNDLHKTAGPDTFDKALETAGAALEAQRGIAMERLNNFYSPISDRLGKIDTESLFGARVDGFKQALIDWHAQAEQALGQEGDPARLSALEQMARGGNTEALAKELLPKIAGMPKEFGAKELALLLEPKSDGPFTANGGHAVRIYDAAAGKERLYVTGDITFKVIDNKLHTLDAAGKPFGGEPPITAAQAGEYLNQLQKAQNS